MDLNPEEKAAYNRAKARRSYRRHRLKVIAKVKDRYERQPHWKRTAGRYNTTAEHLERLMTKQEGRCAICGREQKRLAVDHCHKTGRIRGLLCNHCNLAIGLLKDSADLVQKAADYLRS